MTSLFNSLLVFANTNGAFTQCCFNVGTPSSTLAQHWNSIGRMPRVCKHKRGIQPKLFQCWHTVFDAGPTLKQHWMNAPCLQTQTGHSPKAVSMVAHRLRRWSNIETALGECPVFANTNGAFTQSCFNVGTPSSTLVQHWNSIGRMRRVCKHKRGIHPELFQCWHTVFEAGPTLKQHWVNSPCLLGT